MDTAKLRKMRVPPHKISVFEDTFFCVKEYARSVAGAVVAVAVPTPEK